MAVILLENTFNISQKMGQRKRHIMCFLFPPPYITIDIRVCLTAHSHTSIKCVFPVTLCLMPKYYYKQPVAVHCQLVTFFTKKKTGVFNVFCYATMRISVFRFYLVFLSLSVLTWTFLLTTLCRILKTDRF